MIHEAALISALRSGHVKAAALDTQHLGDMAATLPLSLGGQLINTGRTSGLSDEAAHELRATAAKELRRALMGRIPQDLRFCVNKERIISQTSNAGNSGNSLPTMNPSFNPLAGMNLDGESWISEIHNQIILKLTMVYLFHLLLDRCHTPIHFLWVSIRNC